MLQSHTLLLHLLLHLLLLLQGIVHLDRGTAAQIASCNYNIREPATAYQPWVEALVKQYRAFNEFVKASGLPADVQQKVGP